MPSAQLWHSRPIFITSTFRDMHAERDYLRTVVFPELEERLKERRHRLEPIDLRWGVESVSIDLSSGIARRETFKATRSRGFATRRETRPASLSMS